MSPHPEETTRHNLRRPHGATGRHTATKGGEAIMLDRGDAQQPNLLRQRAETFLRQTAQDIVDMPMQEVQKLVHELQVYQIELEMQNEELRRTQQELQTSRNRYNMLYDFAPV